MNKITDKTIITIIGNCLNIANNIKANRELKSIKNFKISLIECKEDEDNLKVTIYLHRPGLIIGKYGRFIDLVKSAIISITDKSVKLDIIELKEYIY